MLLYISASYLSDHVLTGNLSILAVIVNTIITALFAITIHRVLLLGPNSVSKYGNLCFSNRELNYVGFSLLMAIALSCLFVIALIPFIGLILFIIIAITVFSRLSIALPIIAIDKEWSLKGVWSTTRDFKQLCIFSTIIVPIVVMVPLIVVYALIQNIQAISIIASVYMALATIIITAFLTTTYHYIDQQLTPLPANDTVNDSVNNNNETLD